MGRIQKTTVSESQIRRIVSKLLKEQSTGNNVLNTYDSNFFFSRSGDVLKILNLLFFGIPNNPNRQIEERVIVDTSYQSLVKSLYSKALTGQMLSNAISVVLADRKGPAVVVGSDTVSIEDYVSNLNDIVKYLTGGKNPSIETVYESLEIIMGGRPLDYAEAPVDTTKQQPTFLAYAPDAPSLPDPVTGVGVYAEDPNVPVDVRSAVNELINQGEVREEIAGIYREFVGQSVKPLAVKAELIRDAMIGIKGAPNYLSGQDLYDVSKVLLSAWDADVKLGYAGVSSNVVGSYAVVNTANSIYEESSAEELYGVTLPVITGLAIGILTQNTRLLNVANIPVRSFALEKKIQMNQNRLRRDKVSIADFFGDDDPLYAQVIRAEEELSAIKKLIDDANAEAESLLGVLRQVTGETGDEAVVLAAQATRAAQGRAALDAERKYQDAFAKFIAFRNKVYADHDAAVAAYNAKPKPAGGGKGRNKVTTATPTAGPVEPTQAEIRAAFARREPEAAAIIDAGNPGATPAGLEADITRGEEAVASLGTARQKQASERGRLAAKEAELNQPDKRRLKDTLDELKRDNVELLRTVQDRNKVLNQLKTKGYIDDPARSAFGKFLTNFGARLWTGGNLAHYLTWTTAMMAVFNGVRVLLVEEAKLDATEKMIQRHIISGFELASSGEAPTSTAENHIEDFADDWADAAWYDPRSIAARTSKLLGSGEEELTKLALQLANFSSKSSKLTAQPNDAELLRAAMKEAEPYVDIEVEKEKP